MFGFATPDAAWAHSAFFKGDAHVWLAYASALRAGIPFELGLPLRPPGTAYLVAALWDGSPDGIVLLRWLWALFGAVTVAVLAAGATRALGAVAGATAGLFAACATGLLMLSSTLDFETPYLALVAGSLFPADRLAKGDARALGLWSALQGLACLFRVEHALFVALVVLVCASRWRSNRLSARTMAAATLAIASGFGVALLPWHVHAWNAIACFNAIEPVRDPAEETALRRLETSVSGMDWDAEALQARAALPAFARRTAADFVAATAAWRGAMRVRGADFAILDEAFDATPRPLARRPFVALYGPLNFALANHARASGGFSRAALEQAPALRPNPAAYPPELVSGLPPPDLTLAYPPHAALVNDGYAVGSRWIARDPRGFATLLAAKLGIFCGGATLGFTGRNLPLGASGTRHAVDLTLPAASALVWTWRALWALVAVFGLLAAPRPWPLYLVLWLAFAASKLALTLLFFGYARQGALLIPLLALLAGVLVTRALRSTPARRSLTGLALLAALALAVELARVARPPRIAIDSIVIEKQEPLPDDVHFDQRIDVR